VIRACNSLWKSALVCVCVRIIKQKY